MSKLEDSDTSSAILAAIRAKRERKIGAPKDTSDIEASLLADIESFDLDAAEQRARREQLPNSGAGMLDASLVFPEIAPSKTAPRVAPVAPSAGGAARPAAASPAPAGVSSLLGELRQQAANRQREAHSADTERSAINESVSQALKRVFFFLHDLVQQLNIVTPGIPRPYTLVDHLVLGPFSWQEGFSDYRTQSQSAGALVELVTCSYRLGGTGALKIERDGSGVERLRTMLFDFGLQFGCKEFKNERMYIERAEFQIQPEISVSARWRADFAKGNIVLEARNLERLGSMSYTLRPQSVDQALLDDFGRLMLGLPNRFRELAKR
jgi:hypothetical protein